MRMGIVGGFGLAVAMVALVAGSAQAERLSQQVLADMGLSGLQVMSDADAMAIRGHGYRGRRSSSSTKVWGSSSAEIDLGFAEAEAENGYEARGRRSSRGSTDSFAGVELELDGEIEVGQLDVEFDDVEIKFEVYAGGRSSARGR